ncbi:hypothetical protein CEXT_637101 [Caerostris extrusa]|uniref:Cytochrome c biogenesis B n=1 Tax=Caerostris extrusa TaxID=172846 RepID=A0AAV4TGV5_CAEEX|nr:hypothetical protein CEXT_637101 [Caerostris extrusa]
MRVLPLRTGFWKTSESLSLRVSPPDREKQTTPSLAAGDTPRSIGLQWTRENSLASSPSVGVAVWIHKNLRPLFTEEKWPLCFSHPITMSPLMDGRSWLFLHVLTRLYAQLFYEFLHGSQLYGHPNEHRAPSIGEIRGRGGNSLSKQVDGSHLKNLISRSIQMGEISQMKEMTVECFIKKSAASISGEIGWRIYFCGRGSSCLQIDSGHGALPQESVFPCRM